MKNKDIVIPVVLLAVIAAGIALAYMPTPYHYSLAFEESDGTVSYQYSSNAGIHTTTVVISNTGDHVIEYVAAYVDEGYASINPWDLQIEMFEDMEELLSIRSVDGFGMYDSDSLSEFIENADPASSAIFIASGAISDVIYDGSDTCPLIRWLERGGTVVNMSGCLGKYVSHGPESEDIEMVSGYGYLFAGTSDSAFNDYPNMLNGNASCNEEVRDVLHFYMNECTYGIDVTGMTDFNDIGYVSYSGYSAAVLYKSWNGMVMNFGVSLSTHEHSDQYVAQIIASGMDYSSEILEYAEGSTRGDSSSGEFDVTGPCSIYGFIGSSRPVFADRYDVSAK